MSGAKRKQYFPINSISEVSSVTANRLSPLAPQDYDGPLRVVVFSEEEHRNLMVLIEAAKKWKDLQDNLEERACCGYENIAKKRNDKLYQAIVKVQ